MSFVTLLRTSPRPEPTPVTSSPLAGISDYMASPPYIAERAYVPNGGYTYPSGSRSNFRPSKGLSVGAIIGIVIGVLFVSAVIAKQLSYRWRHGRWWWPRRNTREEETEMHSPNTTGAPIDGLHGGHPGPEPQGVAPILESW